RPTALSFDESNISTEMIQRALPESQTTRGSLVVYPELGATVAKSALRSNCPSDVRADVNTRISALTVSTIASAPPAPCPAMTWVSGGTRAWSEGWPGKSAVSELRLEPTISLTTSAVVPTGAALLAAD